MPVVLYRKSIIGKLLSRKTIPQDWLQWVKSNDRRMPSKTDSTRLAFVGLAQKNVLDALQDEDNNIKPGAMSKQEHGVMIVYDPLSFGITTDTALITLPETSKFPKIKATAKRLSFSRFGILRFFRLCPGRLRQLQPI